MFDPDIGRARHELNVELMDLWGRYLTLGGLLDPIAIEGYVDGLTDVNDIDHDLVVHALNEIYLERGMNHPLAYFRG